MPDAENNPEQDVNNENNPEQDVNNENSNAFEIPEAFKDKPYLKGVDNYDALFTKLDGAETIIGKDRTAIPGEHSTPDDIAIFHKAIGVPDNADDYKPLSTDENTDNSFFDAMRPVFKRAGLNQKSVTVLLEDIGPVLEKITGRKAVADKELDADFDTRMNSLFGSTKDNDLVNAKALMVQHTPESMKADVDSLGNRELAIMASVLKGVRNKYIQSDGSATENNGANKNTSKEELRAEGQKQIAIAQDQSKSLAERETATKRAQELYDQYDK
jgi:hypothetical protein